MKQERGMNERIRSLRKESTTSEPRLSLERSRLVTEAYEKYEGRVPVPMLRALTLQHIMLHKSLYLGPLRPYRRHCSTHIANPEVGFFIFRPRTINPHVSLLIAVRGPEPIMHSTPTNRR